MSLRLESQVQAMPRPPIIRKSLRSLSVGYRGVRRCRLPDECSVRFRPIGFARYAPA